MEEGRFLGAQHLMLIALFKKNKKLRGTRHLQHSEGNTQAFWISPRTPGRLAHKTTRTCSKECQKRRGRTLRIQREAQPVSMKDLNSSATNFEYVHPLCSLYSLPTKIFLRFCETVPVFFMPFYCCSYER